MSRRKYSYKKRRNYKIALGIIIIIILIALGVFLNYQGIIEFPSQKISIQSLNQESQELIGKEVLVEGSIDQCDSVLEENLVMACLKDLQTSDKIAITGEGYKFKENLTIKGILKKGDFGNYIEVLNVVEEENKEIPKFNLEDFNKDPEKFLNKQVEFRAKYKENSYRGYRFIDPSANPIDVVSPRDFKLEKTYSLSGIIKREKECSPIGKSWREEPECWFEYYLEETY